MIVGIGCDLERVAALEAAQALSEPGAFFTEAERSYADRQRDAASALTGHFAAKEAFFKSLAGEQRFFWTEVEVVHDSPHAARFRFSGELARFLAEKRWEVRLSLSQAGAYATAFVTVSAPA